MNNEKLNNVAAALKKNGFSAVIVENSAEAGDWLLEHVATDDICGFGGSLSVDALHLREKLLERGNCVIPFGSTAKSTEQRRKLMIQAMTCDSFFASANAITEAGEIFNVDGTGNRINAITFGPRHCYLVVGKNKIVADVEAAVERLKYVAAPLNAKRLGRETPCTLTGECADCDNEGRICNAYVLLRKQPRLSDITVILVNEDMGL